MRNDHTWQPNCIKHRTPLKVDLPSVCTAYRATPQWKQYNCGHTLCGHWPHHCSTPWATSTHHLCLQKHLYLHLSGDELLKVLSQAFSDSHSHQLSAGTCPDGSWTAWSTDTVCRTCKYDRLKIDSNPSPQRPHADWERICKHHDWRNVWCRTSATSYTKPQHNTKTKLGFLYCVVILGKCCVVNSRHNTIHKLTTQYKNNVVLSTFCLL